MANEGSPERSPPLVRRHDTAVCDPPFARDEQGCPLAGAWQVCASARAQSDPGAWKPRPVHPTAGPRGAIDHVDPACYCRGPSLSRCDSDARPGDDPMVTDDQARVKNKKVPWSRYTVTLRWRTMQTACHERTIRHKCEATPCRTPCPIATYGPLVEAWSNRPAVGSAAALLRHVDVMPSI